MWIKTSPKALFLTGLLFIGSISNANDGAFYASGNQLIPIHETTISIQSFYENQIWYQPIPDYEAKQTNLLPSELEWLDMVNAKKC